MPYLPQYFTVEVPISLCFGPWQLYQNSMYWTIHTFLDIVAACIVFSVSTQTGNDSEHFLLSGCPMITTQWSHKTVVFPPVFCIIEGCIWIKDNSILDLNCTLMKGYIFYVGIITISISRTLYSTISKLIKSAQLTGHTYLMAQHACLFT